MIVIDVGCARHHGSYSVERLLQMFKPDRLIGYDPAPELRATAEALFAAIEAGKVLEFHDEAAWVYDGVVGFHDDGSVSKVMVENGMRMVRCVDLARVIDELPAGVPVVLKIDAEGAEYELLEHLIATGAQARLSRLLIEWHKRGEGKRRHAIEMQLTCPVEQWRW